MGTVHNSGTTLKYDGDGKIVYEHDWKRLTDSELLEIFPEALPIVSKNLSLYKRHYKGIEPLYSELLNLLMEFIYSNDTIPRDEKKQNADQAFRLFYRRPLKEIERRIKALARIQSVGKWSKYEGGGNKITDVDIEQAKQFPIRDILSERNGFVLCPFHTERTPSCKIFADNKFRCFGCGANGDAIDLVMKIETLEFIPAVKFILKR